MQNLYDDLKGLLQQDDRLIVDGKLLKNKIIELALSMDGGLLKLLLSNAGIKKHFFADVVGVLVFDKIKFQKFISNKQFLPDSFTAFKNKIGLTANDEYITESNEVVLAWPYKDCVLEGGQTKEEAKRNEIFWNETLAPDEIDQLLSPKVLTNFKKYDKDGEHTVTEITLKDNLIIKGNNLLALHSLEKNYRGRVKLIYIDPPYNTGGDSFQYNDSFNHSTWLIFMKNRLEIAKKLLKNDGVILVQCDHHEMGYLNVLLDEVFGIENKIQQIAIKVASASGFKAVNPGPIDVLENILFYSKNKKSVEFKKNYVVTGYHVNYNQYLKNNSPDVNDWELIPLKEKVLEYNGFHNEKELKEKFGKKYDFALRQMIEEFAFKNAANVVSVRDLHKPTQQVKALQDQSKINRNKFFVYEKQDGEKTYIINGGALAFYSTKIRKIDGEMQVTELLTNFWDHISWAGIAKEGGVKLKNGKKPEKLIKQIFELNTIEGDIILDYHLGSGTTCAVSHKMNRQYIGIEQIDYGDNDSVVRLENVINGEQSGISKTVNWQGGGSFVYCELAKANQEFIDKIQEASTKEQLQSIWTAMQEKAFISYNVNIAAINDKATGFNDLTLEEQQKFLIEILDKNMLYVPYSSINDNDYNISEEDKKLNKMFYEMKK